ncbi:MAG: Rieske (2Fe-2S) protein [Acidobacteriaceae bacterium]|nr:Rieske (2Fe-2S) protein [Acidobacteriaceae bacterium]
MISINGTVEAATIERRGFLQLAISGIAALLLGGMAALAGPYLLSRPKGGEKDSWADAGELSALVPGRPQELTFERERVDGWDVRREKATAWVVLNTNRDVTAFSPSCTHLGCAYHWDTKAGKFVCPCHGSCFGANGRVLSGPAGRDLDRFETKVEGNRLWLGPVRSSGS